MCTHHFSSAFEVMTSGWRNRNSIITLRAKLSGAVYCYRSCLFVYLCVCLWVCYHDKPKLRASIITKQTWSVGKGSNHLQLIKFWPSCAPGKGSTAGRKFLAPPYYSQRAMFASPLSAFFIIIIIIIIIIIVIIVIISYV